MSDLLGNHIVVFSTRRLKCIYLPGCDMVLTSVTGVIQSPGYGITSYPSVASCSWLISPSVETSIRLVFLDFDLENGMDFLEVLVSSTARSA